VTAAEVLLKKNLTFELFNAIFTCGGGTASVLLMKILPAEPDIRMGYACG
jgi:hypothetical protein